MALNKHKYISYVNNITIEYSQHLKDNSMRFPL
jgi:hypothetical protein